jgi:GT2 family glycosyltransferase
MEVQEIEGLGDTDILHICDFRPIKSSSPLKQPVNNIPNQRPDAIAHSVEGRKSQRIAIGIATRGRPFILAEMLVHLRLQSRRPDSIVVAYSDQFDVADAPRRFPEVQFIRSAPGLTRQRNAILSAVTVEDVVTFLDDDFFLRTNYLAIMEQIFIVRPDVVVATGKILADGKNGPGLTIPEALAIIATQTAPQNKKPLSPTFNAYGCNMSLRMRPIRAHALRFDENLPLYGWYEDVDFSRQLARYGEVVRVENAFGVHLGTKSGRQSGIQLGYSQVANPVYLARKRTVPWRFAVASMLSRSLKNLVRSTNPEPFVDRRGRLRGNVQAWRELISGTISPHRILEL